MKWTPLLALLFACATEVETAPATCVGCHGSEATGLAPPAALGGSADQQARGVGAHTAHLQASLSDPVACTECHVVPATVDAPGHIDDPWPADLTWGPLGTTGGTSIQWDGNALTCSGSYCHGATMAEPGPDAVPDWISTAPQTGCASCHLFPPPAPHPAGGACGDCHAPTAGGNALVNPATHIDGVLQVQGDEPPVVGDNCAGSCHGDDDQPAPDSGAHTVHREPALGAVVACETCHPIPGGANDLGVHIDGNNDLVFDGIANNGATTSAFDAATNTCTTYCHGASMNGGTATAPIWTVVDGSQLGCTACHGNPPPSPHPSSSNCGGCHTSGGSSDPTLHIDGAVNF